MSVDPSVVAALETAIVGDPRNVALRVHLASLLVMGGDPLRALEHAQAALAREPDHLEALVTARDASRALGDREGAERYSRLLGTVEEMAPPFDADRWVETEPFDDDTDEPFAGLDELGMAERPRVTLADVGGLEPVKARLKAECSAPSGGGVLLYGPPGCGKSLLARAVAGELGAQFVALDLDDVLDLWLGESERRLHEGFATARRAAPCVLFLDELDVLAHKRSHVATQLVAELDAGDDGVLVLAATNHPWDVDSALRHPGRLDRTVLVLPPDRPAREAIFRKTLEGRPIREVNAAKLALSTEGCSGADIVHIVETASELALQESVRTGAMHPITHAQLEQAASMTAPSTRAWFATAHSYAVHANDGGQFDDLLAYIRSHKLL